MSEPDDLTPRPAIVMPLPAKLGMARVAVGTRVDVHPAENGWGKMGVYVVCGVAEPAQKRAIGALLDVRNLRFLSPLELLAEAAE